MPLLIFRILAGIILAVFIIHPAPASAGEIEYVLRKLETLSSTVNAQQKKLEKQAAEIKFLRKKISLQQKAMNRQRQKTFEQGQLIEKASVAQAGSGSAQKLFNGRFSFSTDLRLRYEGIYNRRSAGSDIQDRDRFRIRWRLFGDYKVTDELSMHSMLTTSSGSWFDDGKNSHNWQPGRTSNQTIGEELNNKNIYIGRIYAAYQPKAVPGLEIIAGKFKNTFLHTDIMWDPDVNPEGIHERYQYNGWKTVRPFVHLGQMVVSESNKTDDAFLFIWQAGAIIDLPLDVKLTLGGSYYDWQGLGNSDLSRVEGSDAGNTVDADGNYVYGYRLVQGLGLLDFKAAGLPVRLWFDYIENTAEDLPADNDSAWSTGFMLGKDKKKGDWAVYFKYAEIEPDAVIGAVADGDFYGSNRKGYKAQLRYQLFDPWQVRVSWLQTEAMLGPENSEDRFQLDMIWKFKL